MHGVRRRKKRPNNGIRTIEVSRGNNGFGFTISGQQPCILSCIVRDSPAERAGLRSGDYLVAVNGQNVSKVSHDDVVRLIGCSSGVLKLQIAENYYSDSSDDDHVHSNARSKPKHLHKTRNGNRTAGRVAKVVRDLRSGAMFDKYGIEIPSGQETWDLPALPPPRGHPQHFVRTLKEELCFFLGYLGTIEMPKLIQPGSRCQVVRCCVKRLRAEKRSHTWVVMRVHADGVTLTGAGGAVLADYPVHRICYCGPSGDEDRKYLGLVTAGEDGDASPSSSCHIFAVQSSLADHDKHASKAVTFIVQCTSGPLSEGCFEFPSTSESVLNAVRSFCLTKDDQQEGVRNEMLANSPQPSHAGSTAASSNSDSGIGFRDDCGNQSDRIVMVDIENQRLHIQQLCDDGKTLDIQLAGARGQDGPSANLQQAFACVSALCPGELDPAQLSQRLAVRAAARSRSPLNTSDEGAIRLSENQQCCNVPSPGDSYNQSVFHRLGLLPECIDAPGSNHFVKSSENLESFIKAESKIREKCSKSYNDLINANDYKLSPQVLTKPRMLRSVRSSPLSVSYGTGDVLVRDTLPCLSYSMSPPVSYLSSKDSSNNRAEMVCEDRSRSIQFESTDGLSSTYKLSPKVFGIPTRPRVTQSLEELACPPPQPLVWGSLQHLPQQSQATEDKEGKAEGENNGDGAPGWATSFEKLIEDPQGLETFREFLKKEFSQENMTFWCACTNYEQTVDVDERRRLARAIFDLHLAEGAPEPVNVDAHARQHALSLDMAPPDLFSAAQKQIFNLMKFDSYPRFLKSELYQQVVGQSRKLKKSRSDAEDSRRKSLLPWARKNRSKSRDSGDSEFRPSLSRKASEDAASLSSRSSLASWDLALRGSFSSKSCTSKDGSESALLVRVLLADGATAVVQLREEETVRTLMERVLSKRGLSYKAFEVYMAGSPKCIPLDESSSQLASHEVRLEQRVLFRLDLPNRKTVSVKAKATKTLGQVLRPVLHKYNYALEMVTVCSMSENEVLETSVPITAVDGRRLTLLTRSAEVWRGEPSFPPLPPTTKTFIKPGASLDEITNKVFEELLQSKSSGGSSAAGSVHSETSSATIPLQLPLPRFLRRDSAVEKLRMRNRKPGTGSDSDDLYEGLKRAQRSRLEDQRGTEINFELPDFLKDKENSPQGATKMRKLRRETRPATRDSERNEITITEVKTNPCHPEPREEAHQVMLTCKTYETPKIAPVPTGDVQEPSPPRKSDPPPLPPKPKLLPPPYRSHNFIKPSHVKNFNKLNRNRRAAYLDEASSSFV